MKSTLYIILVSLIIINAVILFGGETFERVTLEGKHTILYHRDHILTTDFPITVMEIDVTDKRENVYQFYDGDDQEVLSFATFSTVYTRADIITVSEYYKEQMGQKAITRDENGVITILSGTENDFLRIILEQAGDDTKIRIDKVKWLAQNEDI